MEEVDESHAWASLNLVVRQTEEGRSVLWLIRKASGIRKRLQNFANNGREGDGTNVWVDVLSGGGFWYWWNINWFPQGRDKALAEEQIGRHN